MITFRGGQGYEMLAGFIFIASAHKDGWPVFFLAIASSH